jgi:putative flavoprotein involved in K+ transport
VLCRHSGEPVDVAALRERARRNRFGHPRVTTVCRVASHSVVVVGAGAAGLSTAARLQGAGTKVLVIDRSDSVGSAWRTRYDSFRLHTIRSLSGLPGMAIPRASGSWVARDDFVAYLERYARRFSIRPQFGIELQGLRADAGDGWMVSTSDGSMRARRIVLATGACTEPLIPNWPGRQTFKPTLIHSSQYRNPRAYHGKRVLVVGSGNSASEIAADLAGARDVTVEMAVRTPPTIVRRDTHGVPTQPVGIALRYAPAAIANPLGAALRRLTIPDLSEFGLPRPKTPFSQFQRTGTVPVLDHGFVAAVRSGAITIRTAVTALDGRDVIHADGSRSSPDAVVAATGYRSGLRPILGPLGLLDARDLPTISSRGDPQAVGLYTVGISVLLSGLLREIALDVRRLIRAIAD